MKILGLLLNIVAIMLMCCSFGALVLGILGFLLCLTIIGIPLGSFLFYCAGTIYAIIPLPIAFGLGIPALIVGCILYNK